MITAQWKEITSTPKLSELTSKLQQNMFSESILSKTQDPLPLIIRTSFMSLLKSKYFPANYFLIDNVSLSSFLELVTGTNFLHKYFTVQLVEQAQVFVLNDDNFNLKLNEFRNYVNDCLPSTVVIFFLSPGILPDLNRLNS
jgi:hypothetical protein